MCRLPPHSPVAENVTVPAEPPDVAEAADRELNP
jgi:hypothetical protein